MAAALNPRALIVTIAITTLERLGMRCSSIKILAEAGERQRASRRACSSQEPAADRVERPGGLQGGSCAIQRAVRREPVDSGPRSCSLRPHRARRESRRARRPTDTHLQRRRASVGAPRADVSIHDGSRRRTSVIPSPTGINTQPARRARSSR
jgi:hypothetical protein